MNTASCGAVMNDQKKTAGTTHHGTSAHKKLRKVALALSKMTSTERRRPTSEQWAMRFIIAAIVGFQCWQALMIVEFYGWQKETMANRFTSQDALNLMATHNNDMVVLRAELSSIREMIALLPKEVPPKWFLEDHNSLKDRVSVIEKVIFDGKRR